jgi:tetratricopeptide (TPR) repeat protein
MKRFVLVVVCCLLMLLPAVAQEQPPATPFNAQMQKAWALYQAGKYEDAITEYQRAAEMNPYNVGPYIGLGNTYQKAGRHEEAIAAARRVV